jgi:hypothetical protein
VNLRIAVAALALLPLAACGAISPASDAKATAQSYADMLMGGNFVGASAYMTEECRDEFLGGMALASAFLGDVKELVKGSSLKVERVEVRYEGTRPVVAYVTDVDADLSPGLKALSEMDDESSWGQDPLVYVGGKWRVGCDLTEIPAGLRMGAEPTA